MSLRFLRWPELSPGCEGGAGILACVEVSPVPVLGGVEIDSCIGGGVESLGAGAPGVQQAWGDCAGVLAFEEDSPVPLDGEVGIGASVTANEESTGADGKPKGARMPEIRGRKTSPRDGVDSATSGAGVVS